MIIIIVLIVSFSGSKSLPDKFVSTIFVEGHIPLDKSDAWIKNGMRRSSEACLTVDQLFMRTYNEFYVLNGLTECQEFTFEKESDGNY